VLYWMQRSQRVDWNMALEFAVKKGQELNRGVVVAFSIMPDYPDATARHYHFMLEGLQEVEGELAKRNIKFVLKIGDPIDTITKLAEDAALVVCDRGYLRHMRQWRKKLASQVNCGLFQVEDNVVVPVESASNKREYAARTIRPKIHDQLDDFTEKISPLKPAKSTKSLSISSVDISNVEEILNKLNVPKEPEKVDEFSGGTAEAERIFKKFLESDYPDYESSRQKPHLDKVSFMSPYLHFGQISPLYLLHEMKSRRGENKKAYLEELLVRRELSVNFVFYDSNYDSLQSIPDWAIETLEDHKSDERRKVYTKDELENGETDDPYWNKAMMQMRKRGYLHNHMRMYWGKQILLYTNTPQYAYQVAVELNNKYFLDGRDPNSYANIAWLFGNHDRGWTEREVFGKVRSMTKSGLERKIDTEAWLDK